MGEEDRNYARALAKVITHICNGSVLLNQAFMATKLTALMKPDGGTRPICISEVFRRFAGKVLLLRFKEKLISVLGSFQYGIQKSGREKAILNAKLFLEDEEPEYIHAFLTMDMANAFNAISRARIRYSISEHIPELIPMYDSFYAQSAKVYFNNFSSIFSALKAYNRAIRYLWRSSVWE